jgi:ABC-type nitrate/sulfonate/bicarbonate transport system substrate-binding protein
MAYEKTLWKDHVVDQTTGAVIQQGTPVSAGNLSKQEEAIFENRESVTALAQEMLQAQRDIENNKAEVGEVTLTNTQEYPFNDSQITVALVEDRNTVNDYEVSVDVLTADGPVGDVLVSDKQTNGFKLEYTGSATSVTVKYFLRGGIQ